MPVQTSCSLISSPVIRIEGSSTLYPLTAAVTEEYLHNHPEARLAIGFSGTGGGIRKLIQEEADITDASRPITSREQELARSRGFKFIELQILSY